ncbi:MAG: pyrroloquinoline quinone biosynthesis protein PqqB [Chthoniobacterales bacterium]
MIEIFVLGTAAGGGFPQWNCACANCSDARANRNGLLPRLQSSVAVRATVGPWHLINASPDISRQIERFLRPRQSPDEQSQRNSPIASVALTNADLDHCLGLFALREGPELRVIAPDGVRSSLIRDLHIDAVLNPYNGIRWAFTSEDWAPIDPNGLEIRAVPLKHAQPPRYDQHSATDAPPRCHGVGYQLRHRSHPGVVGVFPDVGWIDNDLLANLAECDIVFFDGTFWHDDEMPSQGLGTRSARDMGHIPMAGTGGSIEALARLTETSIYFLHINNTNPVLCPDSTERKTLATHGMHVAEDGMHVLWESGLPPKITLPAMPRPT